MLLSELLCQIVEARRNPEQNPKISGHSGAMDFFDNDSGGDLKTYGVSMTDIPKLGVNPRSRYKTPIGIYFYPGDYYYKLKTNEQSLPWQDDAPYIQIFKINSNKILYIDQVDQNDYQQLLRKIWEISNQLSKLLQVDDAGIKNLIAKLSLDAQKNAIVNTFGGMFWYILRTLSSKGETRSQVVWNKILRLLDIDVVIDNGSGVIHDNEPTQGVIINPRVITQVKTLDNKPTDNKMDNIPLLAGLLKDAAAKPVNTAAIFLLDQIYKTEAIEENTNPALAITVGNRIIEWLEKAPEQATQLSTLELNTLMRLSPEAGKRARALSTVMIWRNIKPKLISQIENAKQIRSQVDDLEWRTNYRSKLYQNANSSFGEFSDMIVRDSSYYPELKQADKLLNQLYSMF